MRAPFGVYKKLLSEQTFVQNNSVEAKKNRTWMCVDDNFMTSSAPQEMACHDVFSPNQCVFVEMMLKIIVNRFDEKIEAQKENFKKQMNEIKSQFEQISSAISNVTDARRSENMKIRTEIRNPKTLEIVRHSGFSNNSKELERGKRSVPDYLYVRGASNLYYDHYDDEYNYIDENDVVESSQNELSKDLNHIGIEHEGEKDIQATKKPLHKNDISQRQDFQTITGAVTNSLRDRIDRYSVPFAAFGGLGFGGISVLLSFHQQRILKEHRSDIDQLKVDLARLSSIIENLGLGTVAARLEEVESRVDNTANSFNDICDKLESGSGNTAIHCCVNGANNKMRCEQKSFLDLPLIQAKLNIDTSTDGVCDRRAFGIPPVANACSDNPP